MPLSSTPVRLPAVAALATAVLLLTGCSASPAGSGGDDVDVRLGYFPNLTHAPAIYGVERGYFADELGDEGATLTTQTFNSGSDTIKALLAGGLDATFIGPSPTVSAFVTSLGEGVRVVSGATSSGAALVVQPGIDSIADLVGQKVGTPGLGNTQDVAVRHYLAEEGYATDLDGGGDIAIVPQDNATTLQTFQQGEIAGAWVPEPYVSLLVEAGGTVLVDEADLWPDGQFVTTLLLVRTEFLEEHPELVTALVEATVQSVQEIEADPAAAQEVVGAALFELTQNRLDPAVLDSAWDGLTFTFDPLPATLSEDARQAEELGLLSGELPDLAGLYSLEILNGVLTDNGLDPVSVDG